jgi:hypothetical protein
MTIRTSILQNPIPISLYFVSIHISLCKNAFRIAETILTNSLPLRHKANYKMKCKEWGEYG